MVALPPPSWPIIGSSETNITQPWYTYLKTLDAISRTVEADHAVTAYTSSDGAQTIIGSGSYTFTLNTTTATITHTIGPPIVGSRVLIAALSSSTGTRITTTSTSILIQSMSSALGGWFLNFTSTTNFRRPVEMLGRSSVSYLIINNPTGATVTTT